VDGLRRTCEREGAVLLVPDAVGGQWPLEYPQVLQHRVQCTLSVTLNKFTVILNTLFLPFRRLETTVIRIASTLIYAYSTYSKSRVLHSQHHIHGQHNAIAIESYLLTNSKRTLKQKHNIKKSIIITGASMYCIYCINMKQ
jgi:hypothetical protein